MTKPKPTFPKTLTPSLPPQDVNFSVFPIMNVNIAGNYSLKLIE